MSEESKKNGDATVSRPEKEPLQRRLLLFKVGTILSAAVAATLGARTRARAQETDSDTGENADPPGKGRGKGSRESKSNTDSDWGPGRDPVGGAKPLPAAKNGDQDVTDSDTGPNADVRGKGKGKSSK